MGVTMDRSQGVVNVEAGLEAVGGSGRNVRWDHGRLAGAVTAAARGEEAAWSLLVDGLAPVVWSVIQAYRLGPEDAANVSQTTWLRLAQHIDRFHEPEGVAAWLARTAARECLGLLKKNQPPAPTSVIPE